MAAKICQCPSQTYMIINEDIIGTLLNRSVKSRRCDYALKSRRSCMSNQVRLDDLANGDGQLQQQTDYMCRRVRNCIKPGNLFGDDWQQNCHSVGQKCLQSFNSVD